MSRRPPGLLLLLPVVSRRPPGQAGLLLLPVHHALLLHEHDQVHDIREGGEVSSDKVLQVGRSSCRLINPGAM